MTPFAVALDGTAFVVGNRSVFIYRPDGNTATATLEAPGAFPSLSGIAVDSQGRAYAADQSGNRIWRIMADGTYSIVAGLGSPAPLSSPPVRIAVDSEDRIVFSARDGSVARMRPSSPPQILAAPGVAGLAGVVAAGRGGVVYFFDRISASMKRIVDGNVDVVLERVVPSDIGVDPEGRLLVAETAPPRIWRLEGNGARTTIAGLDPDKIPVAGPTQASLNSPRAVALDDSGNLYIADTDQNRILRRSASGVVETVLNGAEFPSLLAAGSDGAVYFASAGNRTVKRWTASGQAVAFAGNGDFEPSPDGIEATRATFLSISGIAWTPRGLAIADQARHAIRFVDSAGIIRRLAGNGTTGLGASEGVSAVDSPVVNPGQMAMNRRGDFVFFEQGRLRFRAIDSAGIVTSLPDTTFVDGVSADRCFLGSSPTGMAFDSTNSLIFSTRGLLCRREPNGTTWWIGGDYGRATGIAIDAEDRIYVADSNGNRIFRLDPDALGAPFALQPKITAVVGAGGSRSPSVTQSSPGALMTIYGSGFAPAATLRAVQASDLVDSRLPTRLEQVCVLFGGVRAPLTFVSEGQINFQVPTSGVGIPDVRVVANCDGAQEFSSTSFRVDSRRATPEFLYWRSTGANRSPVVAVEASTNAYIGPANLLPGLSFRPARPGDILTIYCIGLGVTKEPVAAGEAPARASEVGGPVQVFLGNQMVAASNVSYVGVSPGIAGLYQINLRVPDVADGEQPLRVVVDGQSSPQDGFLTIRRAN